MFGKLKLGFTYCVSPRHYGTMIDLIVWLWHYEGVYSTIPPLVLSTSRNEEEVLSGSVCSAIMGGPDGAGWGDINRKYDYYIKHKV